jgi:hypothetical protein
MNVSPLRPLLGAFTVQLPEIYTSPGICTPAGPHITQRVSVLALPRAGRLVGGYLHRAASERCQGRDAADNNAQVILDHGPHYELGAVDVIGEGLDGEDADELDHGDEYGESSDLHDDIENDSDRSHAGVERHGPDAGAIDDCRIPLPSDLMPQDTSVAVALDGKRLKTYRRAKG